LSNKKWRVPFIQPFVSEETKRKVLEILERGKETGSFTVGEETQIFEENLAKFCNVRHAITLHSGTEALFAALVAAEIKPGDEVITTSLTFIATIEAIWQVKAKPILVDIHPEYYTIEPDLIKKAITNKTKAILPVHIYGQAVDMDPIMELANDNNLFILEDTCQALGGRYKKETLGSIGDAAALSFHPQKNLTVCGDGGALLTNRTDVAETVEMIRDHGRLRDQGYDHQILGYNFRLGEIRAGIANVALPHLGGWNVRRREIAKQYINGIDSTHTICPKEAPYSYHVYDYYEIQTQDRDGLRNELTKKGIKTDIQYPKACHQQVVWEYLEGKSKLNLPITDKLIPNILTLPSFPDLTDEQVSYVIETMNNYYKSK